MVLKILSIVGIYDVVSMLYNAECSIHNTRSSLQLAVRPRIAQLLVSRLLVGSWEVPMAAVSAGNSYTLTYGQVASAAAELLHEIDELAASVGIWSGQRLYH